MNNRINLIYNYLFNGLDDPGNKIKLCKIINDVFNGEEPFQIVINIQQRLEQDGDIPSYTHYVENYSFLEALTGLEESDIPTLSEAKNLVDLEVRDKIQRDIATAVQKAIDRSSENDTSVDLVNSIANVVSRYAKQGASNENLLRPTELYAIRKTQSRGILTFLEPVDRLVNSFEMGTVSVIAAGPRTGKTTLSQSILYKNCIENGYNGLMVSLEVKRDMIWYSIIARHSFHEKFVSRGAGLPAEKFRRVELSSDEELFFKEVEDDIYTNPDYGKVEIVGQSFIDSYNLYGLRSAISKLPFVPDFIIIDYAQLLQYVNHPKEIQFAGDPVNYYIRQLTALAEDIDGNGNQAHIVLLSQLNAAGLEVGEETGGKYPLTALAQHNELNRSASYVIFLHADDALRESKELKVYLAKNRFGPMMLDPAVVVFDPRFQVVGDAISENNEQVNFDDLISADGLI